MVYCWVNIFHQQSNIKDVESSATICSLNYKHYSTGINSRSRVLFMFVCINDLVTLSVVQKIQRHIRRYLLTMVLTK
jgi:hypothetical protein